MRIRLATVLSVLAAAPAAQGAPALAPGGSATVPGVRWAGVAPIGPRTIALSAERSAAVWTVRRRGDGRLERVACVPAPFQPGGCRPAGPGGVSYPAPLLAAGRDVYVVEGRSGVLVHWRLRRGVPRFAGCLADDGPRRCAAAGAAAPDDAEQLALVHRGRMLAITTGLGHVALLRRDPATGRLTPAGCVGQGSSCRHGLLPQGSGRWIAGSGSWLFTGQVDSLTAWDPGTGAPAARRGDCLSDAGSALAEVDSLPHCRLDQHAAGDTDFGMPLLATDDVVYGSDWTTGATDTGVAWWRRSAGGGLRFAGCLSESAGGGDGDCTPGSGAIADPRLLAITPDRRVLVVAGTDTQGVAVLAADPRTGALRFPPAVSACATADGTADDPFNPPAAPTARRCLVERRLDEPAAMTLDPAGRVVYVVAGDAVLSWRLRR